MIDALPPVITIDGPVGSGKGTIAGLLADTLGWHLLDSGALYRLVAIRAMELEVAPKDEAALAALAESMQFSFGVENGITQVFLNNREVSGLLRSELISAMASKVAVCPAVRSALMKRQLSFRQSPGLVADGRDMGTVVFPDAELKIFLTASVNSRAERRYKQLKEKGESVNLSRLSEDLKERDLRDSSRAIAPLVPAADAYVIDSTDQSINEVLDKIKSLVKEVVLKN